MDRERNLYERGLAATTVERRRLAEFGYPMEVTKNVLGDITGGSLLDIGVGSNTELEAYALAKNISYRPLDYDLETLKDRINNGFLGGVSGSITDLPWGESSFDVLHARLVLGHLGKERRIAAFQEMLRVASRRVVVIDVDWSTFQGGREIMEFIDWSIPFFEETGFNPYYGTLLKTEMEQVFKNGSIIKEQVHNRGQITKYDEVIGLANSFLMTEKGVVSSGTLDKSYFEKLEEIIVSLKTQMNSTNPQTFIAPNFVSVEVVKENEQKN